MTRAGGPRRPGRLVVIAGTGTEVGKTFVAAALARELRARGVAVQARKPVQSYDPDAVAAGPDPGAGGVGDAGVLAAATGEDPGRVCPPGRSYELAMAPPLAAAALGRPPYTVIELAAEVLGSLGPEPPDVALVELAGGPRSPMAGDGDGVDLTSLLAPDVCVLVADAGLGTLNVVRLCVPPLAEACGGLHRVGVLLNRYDDDDLVHTTNRAWLDDRIGCPVWTTATEASAMIA